MEKPYMTNNKNMISEKLNTSFGVTPENASDRQIFAVCAKLIREEMSKRVAGGGKTDGGKHVHYLSMEFLMGRSLAKNAFNMGLLDSLSEAIRELGREPADIFEIEPDAGLGNGGLGRLAACYMDSMASQNIPATGYSICYELGIFRQKFKDGKQTEESDDWLPIGENWLIPNWEESVEVRFGGRIEPYWNNDGTYHARHTGYTPVIALPRDMLIAGYGTDRVNTLRLWEAHSDKSLDMSLFSSGEYIRSLEQRTMTEVITKVLYPADDHMEGKALRIKQQYFFVSATCQTIVRDHFAEHKTVENFADCHVMQINDTHPTLIIPELMRLFMDEHGLGWDKAWDIVSKTAAYTNHTILSEALETWPQGLLQNLLPRVFEIICEIDRRRRDLLNIAYNGDRARVARGAILEGGKVHMANLCLSACFKINGVSTLHGEILRNDIFRDDAGITPERFTSVTNGIDHRRWLTQINPKLHRLIVELCGNDRYLTEPERLSELEAFAADRSVLDRILAIKHENKESFSSYIKETSGQIIDPSSVFDVQVKRLHEYKRQLLCALHICQLRNFIRDNPNADFVPRTYIFGAKAASGYKVAKRIIQFILSLSKDIAEDPLCSGKLKVLFVENYRVSLAERLMPAATVSEQISTAGKEASGTGNMKLMMNGAITIGTLDGANVEMHEVLGDENMFLFGLKSHEVAELKARGYDPMAIASGDPELMWVFKQLNNGFSDGESYADLASRLLYQGDEYMLIADYNAYREAQASLYNSLKDPEKTARLSLINTSRSGIFAADRAIAEYRNRIWAVNS
ncbi:glycogen/starch/alpha-glucan family phosphorylase [Clostridiaceae bacterium OttesenSCG-928-D20]|nr:glycogen/starch/alpha-glucan family phosphorylase [Clostridiaceae bacterium OttesenSCG-928-D20]